MRVLVDAHMLGHRETGNETYVRGLLAGLASLEGVTIGAAVDPDFRAEGSGLKAVEWIPLPTSSGWRRLSVDLARLGRGWRADVIHATYIAPFGSACPVILSVHDVSFRRYPEYFSWRDRTLFATLLPASLRRAAAILTLSAHSRDELREFYPGLRAPIHVVPAAPGASFRPMTPAECDPVLRRYDVRRPYLLAVGNIQPRKNLARLVEAYAALRHGVPDLQLVLVGPSGFRSTWVQDTIVSRGLSDAVRLPGYVGEADLVALYNAATVLVYPSIYEGFGLPVVEAMACGRPVIAANTSSLPEVAGDAAVLVDPFDVSAIESAISRVVAEPELAADLGARGLARAAQFTWQRTAAAALRAYETATSGRERTVGVGVR